MAKKPPAPRRYVHARSLRLMATADDGQVVLELGKIVDRVRLSPHEARRLAGILLFLANEAKKP